MDQTFRDPHALIKGTLLINIKSHADFARLTRAQALNFINKTASVLAKNYPERVEKIIIYPVPSKIRPVIHGLNFVLASDIMTKVKVLYEPKEQAYQQLYEYVGFDQLPQQVQRYYPISEID